MLKSRNNTTFAAYRVFETLAFLMRQPANVAEITKYLESLDKNGKTYSKALIYKYLSTLKFAGIELKRHKCKYEIGKLPFRLDFSKEDVEALSVLKSLLKYSPEKDVTENINKFFYQLNTHYDFDNASCLNENVECKNQIKLKKSQIKEVKDFETLKDNGLRLKITYKNVINEVTTILCEIIDVYTNKGNVYLNLYNINQACFLILNTKQIEEFEETPQRYTRRYFSSTTIFKLKGKLAKRYTLRNEECSLGFDSKGCLSIASKKEPKEELFLRLMRYGVECEVISPRIDREIMRTMVKQALKNYDM